MAAFYDATQDALSFVMPQLLEILPNIHFCLGLILSVLTLAFLLRIVMTWYPKVNLKEGFWPLLGWPTEPFLRITRTIVPPIGGVDVTPVIWVGLISLVRELLVGQQGLISQMLLHSQATG